MGSHSHEVRKWHGWMLVARHSFTEVLCSYAVLLSFCSTESQPSAERGARSSISVCCAADRRWRRVWSRVVDMNCARRPLMTDTRRRR